MISKWVKGNIAVLLIAGISGCAQTPVLEEEVAALKQNQESMRKDLEGLKKWVADRTPKQPKPFEPKPLNISGAPVLGKSDAPVTLVEFTDYQCPFCKRHALGTLPQIVKEYVDTGKVKYVLRDFPLNQIHANAAKLAEAVLCAGDQGKAWEMHDHIFKAKKSPDPNKLVKDAKTLGLDAKAFGACMQANKYAGKVNESLAEGSSLGVRGTPGFFLGKTDMNDSGKITATEMISGAQAFATFEKSIDKMLADSKSAEKAE
jgi:protein-disulfide isomerase